MTKKTDIVWTLEIESGSLSPIFNEISVYNSKSITENYHLSSQFKQKQLGLNIKKNKKSYYLVSRSSLPNFKLKNKSLECFK